METLVIRIPPAEKLLNISRIWKNKKVVRKNMSVLHQLNIAPQSNTSKSLSDIQRFISELIKDGLILEDFDILTGQSQHIADITTWDFNGNSHNSKVSGLCKLTILENVTFDSLVPNLNYAFKVQLTKEHAEFKCLDVFQSTEEVCFPLFISYLADPINYRFYDGDDEGFVAHELANINCVIRSDGRNSKALWDLLDNKQDYKSFFDKVSTCFENFVSGSNFE